MLTGQELQRGPQRCVQNDSDLIIAHTRIPSVELYVRLESVIVVWGEKSYTRRLQNSYLVL